MNTDTTPCFGKSDLFDSTDLNDHIVARNICATCPIIDACRNEALAALAAPGGAMAVDGTWGGQLWRGGRISKALEREHKRAEEDAAYTQPEAARCSQLYTEGDRSTYVTIGRRVYDRRRYQKRLADAS